MVHNRQTRFEQRKREAAMSGKRRLVDMAQAPLVINIVRFTLSLSWGLTAPVHMSIYSGLRKRIFAKRAGVPAWS